MKIDIIAGARPNFIKIASITKAINDYNSKNISYRLIHTGQHYDENMSKVFFDQLGIPKPHINFEVGSSSYANQVSNIMIEYEKLLGVEPADICLVVGDVNSTVASSIVAKQRGLKVAHIEAGLRSRDMSMPEEINRLLTDSITDYFFTTSKYANKNLTDEGVPLDKIFFVGNTMIDTLIDNIPNLYAPKFYLEQNMRDNHFIVLTLHRPSNVDNLKNLFNLLDVIDQNVDELPVIFPIHPRTEKILSNNKTKYNNICFTPPLPYLEFNYIVKNARCMITDSGGITEETTYMKIPCITLRENTERPETVSIGSNVLSGTDTQSLIKYLNKVKNNDWKNAIVPELWDGKAGKRIIEVLTNL